ncbi:MAG: trimethylamine methyltransferase family protein [Sedimentisphaerales bacterium]
MIKHPLKYSEKLTSGDIESILTASFNVLSETGLFIQSDYILKIMKKAGAAVDEHSGNIRFPAEMVKEYLKYVPAEWTFYARNPQRNVQVGGRNLLVAPGYGSAFIADSQGRRRNATIADLEKLSLLAYSSDVIDLTGGLLVEPNDISPQLRPMEITLALIRNSDKPFMGSVTGKDGARESLEIAKIVFGNIDNKPCVMALINISSPMRLNATMADAMVEYANACQPVLLTPGILMGMTAPVTAIGALVQAYAELLGCVTITQVLRPGLPVIIGTGGFGSDLRSGGTGFGRPENALGIQLGAEIARKLNIPFRCTAAVTGARRPDCRSGYERMMTAMTAYYAGAHFCLQAAGILDSINTMSYEQYIIDMEIWSYIKHFARPLAVNKDTLAQDVIEANKSGFLEHEHTLKYMRQELHSPSLANPDNYDDWWAAAGPDVVSQAAKKVKQIFENLKPPPMDESIDRRLREYALRRRKVLEQVSG